MKKKILIGSIFTILLMLSMPMISNIQAQPANNSVSDECEICTTGECRPFCGLRMKLWSFRILVSIDFLKWSKEEFVDYYRIPLMQDFHRDCSGCTNNDDIQQFIEDYW
jgi:hypothetical protein